MTLGSTIGWKHNPLLRHYESLMTKSYIFDRLAMFECAGRLCVFLKVDNRMRETRPVKSIIFRARARDLIKDEMATPRLRRKQCRLRFDFG